MAKPLSIILARDDILILTLIQNEVNTTNEVLEQYDDFANLNFQPDVVGVAQSCVQLDDLLNFLSDWFDEQQLNWQLRIFVLKMLSVYMTFEFFVIYSYLFWLVCQTMINLKKKRWNVNYCYGFVVFTRNSRFRNF